MLMYSYKLMLKPFRFLLVALFVLSFAGNALAQAPQLINFQAQVDNFPAGPTEVTFSIYAAANGGTPMWAETHTITSPDGIIQVLLGSVDADQLPLEVFNSDGERHLELVIDGEILSPRFQLTSVAYAYRSSVADDLAGGAVSTVNTLSGDVVLKEGANVAITQNGQEITIASTAGGGGGGSITTVSGGSGIEVTDPNGPLVVVYVEEDGLNDSHITDNSLTASSLASASVESNELANGTAVRNINGLSDGVTLAGGDNVTLSTQGQTITINAAGGGTGGGITNLVAGNGIAINDTDGPTSTISLQNQIDLGADGSITTRNGSGQEVTNIGESVAGGRIHLTQPGNGNFVGVDLNIRDLDGQGAGGQIQVRGNNNWDAIQMFADGSTEGGRMVFREPEPGNSQSALTSLAFRGENSRGQIITFKDNSGFISLGGDTDEVKSRGAGGFGLSQSEYDSNSSLPAALYVNGSARITGGVSSSITTSSIDHPQDPENKILSHSGVISAEQMTIYTGNVVLGNQGEATVQLPEWFESLNANFRYQLTTIGGWARVYIAEKVSGNQFSIAGGREGMEVSWQITASRKDPYAIANPMEVETTKEASAQGTYINPEVYGVSNDQ